MAIDGMYWILFLSLIAAVFAKFNARKALIRQLMVEYNRDVVPEDTPINVTHSLEVERLLGLKDQILSLDGYISLQWRDSGLRWDPAEFDGITVIRIPNDLIWKPDIMLENNSDRPNAIPSSDVNAVIAYDGVVFFIPPVKLNSYCNMPDLTPPSGTEVTCTLNFLSWTYDGLIVNLETASESNLLSLYDHSFNKDWKLLDMKVRRNVSKYACCPEPYIELKYTLELMKLSYSRDKNAA